MLDKDIMYVDEVKWTSLFYPSSTFEVQAMSNKKQIWLNLNIENIIPWK